MHSKSRTTLEPTRASAQDEVVRAHPADSEYRSLAAFRYHVRRFAAFSDAAIEAAGLTPMQYQALLAIRAHGADEPMTATQLADQLYLRLNSTVELVDRLQAAGLVTRTRSTIDRRRVQISLTEHGETVLAPLAAAHVEHHREHLKDLVRIIKSLDA